MSEGFTNIPATGKAGPQSGRNSGDAQIARILRLPDNLEQVVRARRLEGEVIQQNRDGFVKVRTPQGDIDIQIKGRQQPQPGQKVEIDLPAGRPPRQLVIRPEPAQVEIRRPATSSSQAQGQSQNVSRGDGTPQTSSPRIQPQQLPQAQAERIATPQVKLPPGYKPTPQAQVLPPTPQAPLNTGDVVRLLPVPPAQAQQILQQAALPADIQPAQLQRLPFVANVIAQNAQSDLQNIALQIRPAAIQQAVTQLNTALQVTQQTQFTTQITTPQTQPVQTLPATNNLTFTPPVTQQPLQIQNLITLPLTQTIEAVQSQLQNATLPRLGQIDAQILQIRPPDVQLVPPQGQTTPAAQLNIGVKPSVVLTQGQPSAITAQVAGFTAQNLPLISLQLPGSTLPQNFILQFNASNLQVGSKIQILPQASLPTLTSQVGSTPQPLSFTNLLRGLSWPSVEQLYQTLSQTSQPAAQAMARTLPSPANPAQLGAAAMFFIGAVKSGDITSWLGDRKVDLLQRVGRGNLMGQLTQDAATINRAEPVGGDWRAVPLPMFWDNEIHKITLFTRKDGQGQGDEQDKGQQTRFIFDLNLTRMGDVQLDGLLRGERLDLIVRTQNPFSVSMQQAMRQAYVGALESTGLNGELNFQGDPRQWVNVLKEEETLGVNA